MKAMISVVLVCMPLLLVGTGCRLFSPAEVPSNQPTPIVWNDATRDVLMNASSRDVQVLASTLESQTESGSVLYVNHEGWVYNPDGTLFLDQNGRPIKVTTKVIAKLNSLKELANMSGVSEASYVVGGFDYVDRLPEQLKGKDLCPEALRLEIKGIDQLQAVDTTAENRRAAAEERAAIFTGMSRLAEARGASFALRVEALADGAVGIITATGQQIVARVVGTAPIEAGIAGASKVIQAVIEDKDGGRSIVVAEGDAADIIEKAAP